MEEFMELKGVKGQWFCRKRTTFVSEMGQQRIGYIDAMRGFTMILVVYSHVCGFCLGETTLGYNDVFFLFRLPCFFMISGWLFEQTAHRPFWQVIRKKFMVQIVPTFIFLLLLAPPPLFFSRLGTTKGGYWFTFTLFVFFMLYLLTVRMGRRWGAVVALLVSISAFCYSASYNRLASTDVSPIALSALGFLSFATWRYYLFFYLGTVIRRRFDVFTRLTDLPYVVVAIVLTFLIIALTPTTDDLVLTYLRFAVAGAVGMTMVFSLFRRFECFLNRESHLGRSLQFIGTRTLDIYLLHYFFLPRFLLRYSNQLQAFDSKLLELLVAMAVALAVVGTCLLASYIIRLSPFLAHYLFGAKSEKDAK